MARARGLLAEILRIAPRNPEALVKKGAALERMTRDEEAIRCYDRAIEADGSLTLADGVHISASTVVSSSMHKPGQYTGFFPIDDNAA